MTLWVTTFCWAPKHAKFKEASRRFDVQGQRSVAIAKPNPQQGPVSRCEAASARAFEPFGISFALCLAVLAQAAQVANSCAKSSPPCLQRAPPVKTLQLTAARGGLACPKAKASARLSIPFHD